MGLVIDQQITFLYTGDLARTAPFYEDILHLPLVVDQGRCRIYGVTSTSCVGVCERADAVPDPAGVIFALVVSDVDAWYMHLKDMGVQFEKPPAVNETYGIYHCFAKDPNGYLIEIQRFLDPDWNRHHQTE